MRFLLLAVAALALSGCYVLKGRQPANIGMSEADYAYIDASRRPPDGENVKYFRGQGRGPNGELVESSIQGWTFRKAR